MSHNYLLDTHILVWSVLSPERLSSTQRTAVQAADVLYVSAISAWEIVMLIRLGRLEVEGAAAPWVVRAMAELGAVALPVTFDVGMEAAQLEYEQRDPADRIIIATSRIHGLRLVTADRKIQSWAGVRTLQ